MPLNLSPFQVQTNQNDKSAFASKNGLNTANMANAPINCVKNKPVVSTDQFEPKSMIEEEKMIEKAPKSTSL